MSRHNAGKVYLVGAGPGDPALITLRTAQVLSEADLVLYDYLVNPRVLEHAASQAECVCLGRHGRDRLWTQDEINKAMVTAARAGKQVVRLKSGDPMIFGRAAEELTALAHADVPHEVVPGVTAALAVSALARVPLTSRMDASAVALVTGQENAEKAESSLDFAALARFPGTLAIYMGVTTARHWARQLIEAGKPGATPALVVHRVSWPTQRTMTCTLEQVADVLESQRIRPPVLVMIGDVVPVHSSHQEVSQRPLAGRRIVVTRAVDQSASLRDRLEVLGAEVLVQPAIQIGPPADWSPVDEAIANLDTYDWLIFSSVNGVEFFLGRLLSTGHDLRKLGRARLAAMGPATAEALLQHGLRCDLQPSEYRAEALAADLSKNATGKRLLILRASRGRDVLGSELRQAGAIADEVVVYSSADVEQADEQVAAAVAAGQVNYLTVTSSAIARSIIHLFGKDLSRLKIVSISPLTSQALRDGGLEPAAEAQSYTTEGLIAALLELESRAPRPSESS